MKRIALLLLLGLAGCATAGIPPFCDMSVGPNGQTVCDTPAPKTGLPYRAWRLGFFARPYMEVWVETADVEDVRGRIFHRAGSGTVALHYNGNPSGWPTRPGWGAGRDVTGADLPKRIYVRWQSLIEPQTYRATLEIPDEARRLMVSKASSIRDSDQQDYQSAMSIGLAPGGVVRIWVMSAGSEPIEVFCQQAEIEPKGPSQGLTSGRYAYSFDKLELATQRYLKTHPIPYDSWKCPKRSR